MKYRKKPVIVEAMQLKKENVKEVLKFINSKNSKRIVQEVSDGINIKTLEGVMHAKFGDWIIKGIKGEFYPCKPDIFMKTYEKVDNEKTKNKKS